jgi:hypothetical protein
MFIAMPGRALSPELRRNQSISHNKRNRALCSPFVKRLEQLAAAIEHQARISVQLSASSMLSLSDSLVTTP